MTPMLMTMIVAVVVAVCATVATVLGALDPTALAGLLGTILGGGAVATTPGGRQWKQ